MPKKRKLNSKNPKYMDKEEEVKRTRELIATVKKVRIYAVFNE
jgi:hypothetical protein|tara:strand:- start:1094 stop:1222 length:129 start_codon:yes stop_codon:yes gene_type:complete